MGVFIEEGVEENDWLVVIVDSFNDYVGQQLVLVGEQT